MTESLLDHAAPSNADPLFAAAAALCRELTAGSVRPPAQAPSGWLRLLRREDPLHELDRHRAALAADPRDALAVWRAARFVERIGYPDLAAVLLSELHKRRPADPKPAAALARLFLARARRPGRGLAARLKDYDRFERYADRALAHGAADEQLHDLKTAAAVEVTVLKGQYDLGGVR